MRTIPRSLLLVAMLALADEALGKTILVTDGPGTPLQDAIDAAAPGDTVRLVPGSFFTESIVVDKPLKIHARSAAIAAGCAAAAAVTIAASDVKLSGGYITGGTFFEIDVQNQDRVTIKGVNFGPTCLGVEYGINVYQCTEVKVQRNEVHFGSSQTVYADAFIYIGGIPADARVRVERNFSNIANGRGIIVEDSTDTPTERFGVRVKSNRLLYGGTGILLANTDGAEVRSNFVNLFTGAGIEADATSNGNRIEKNRLGDNGPDVLDNGSGNCWKDNVFTTGSVPPCP
jgi:nitrous oxidase accessory protein NosD